MITNSQNAKHHHKICNQLLDHVSATKSIWSKIDEKLRNRVLSVEDSHELRRIAGSMERRHVSSISNYMYMVKKGWADSYLKPHRQHHFDISTWKLPQPKSNW